MKTEAVNIPANTDSGSAKTVKLRDLLGTGKAVMIDHDGDRYSLRLTSKGKLLLTK